MIPLEEDEQKTLIQYLKAKRLFYFAPINENTHSKANRKLAIMLEQKAKSMGKVKGTPDVIVMLQNKILFIELKRIKGSYATDEQKEFLEKVNSFIYAKGKVCKGAKEAIEFIESEI